MRRKGKVADQTNDVHPRLVRQALKQIGKSDRRGGRALIDHRAGYKDEMSSKFISLIIWEERALKDFVFAFPVEDPQQN